MLVLISRYQAGSLWRERCLPAMLRCCAGLCNRAMPAHGVGWCAGRHWLSSCNTGYRMAIGSTSFFWACVSDLQCYLPPGAGFQVATLSLAQLPQVRVDLGFLQPTLSSTAYTAQGHALCCKHRQTLPRQDQGLIFSFLSALTLVCTTSVLRIRRA